MEKHCHFYLEEKSLTSKTIELTETIPRLQSIRAVYFFRFLLAWCFSLAINSIKYWLLLCRFAKKRVAAVTFSTSAPVHRTKGTCHHFSQQSLPLHKLDTRQRSMYLEFPAESCMKGFQLLHAFWCILLHYKILEQDFTSRTYINGKK